MVAVMFYISVKEIIDSGFMDKKIWHKPEWDNK